MNYSVGIVSLGCAKNRVDAEIMMHKLRQGGYILKSDPAMKSKIRDISSNISAG